MTTNQRATYCNRCGFWLLPGQGELERLTDGRGDAWIVTHLDRQLCDANLTAEAREAARKADEDAANKIARDTILENMTRVEPFDFSDFSQVVPGIYTGVVNNKFAAVEIIPSHDGPDHRFFYSANPAAAGLTPKEY